MTKVKGFSDITEKWCGLEKARTDEVIDLKEYTVGGITHKVDGKHVLLDPTDKERKVAELLKREIGGNVSMVPRVLNPQGVSTPDYIFRDEAFDLKELSGTSKNLLYNAVAKKKKQASNFVLDISQCPLTEEEIYRQIEYVYWSKHTNFINKLILVKDDQIIKIFARDK